MTQRFDAADLRRFATAACMAQGLDAERAACVADVLVEGDLMGHDTHGLALLAGYLDALASGDMQAAGDPRILSETPVVQAWHGEKLPGPWLVRRAIAFAEQAAGMFGIGADREQAAMHLRMQRLDAAIHHFGKAGEL